MIENPADDKLVCTMGHTISAVKRMHDDHISPIWSFLKMANFLDKGVSKNSGTQKWMVYNGKPY